MSNRNGCLHVTPGVRVSSPCEPLALYTHAHLPDAEPCVVQHLPCVDCNVTVPVHLPPVLPQDKILILCDPCLGARVATVKAQRGENVLLPDPAAAHDEHVWRFPL
jgi:hypothetical protein